MAKAKGIDLSDKQLLFCQEYLIDLNGTQAAIRAGYSAKSATVDSSRMLTYAKVQEFIQELKLKRSEKLEITSDMVLRELSKIGFSDIGDFFNDGYSIKPLSELKDKSKVIQSIQVDETVGEFGSSRTIKFKLHDKLSALEKIGKHIGFFEKDNEQQKDKAVASVITVYASGPPMANSEDKIS